MSMSSLMTEFLPEIQKMLKPLKELNLQFVPLLHALSYFLIGMMITLIIRWFVGKIVERQVSNHHAMLFRRIILYIGLAFSLILPLNASGIDVTALLGAAGILTAVVAFAAQTSISNFLSGVFLVAEKPFIIGDDVQINGYIGEVLSIDLLSVKIRTKDNTLVRIPNESFLKAQFRNLSRFAIRRFDMHLRVAFDEDLEKIKDLLFSAAAKNPLCLVNPTPELVFIEFGDAGIHLQFSVWGKQSTFDEMKSLIQTEIQALLSEKQIQLPIGYSSILAPQTH